MGLELRILEINRDNAELLQDFINGFNGEQHSFRYFERRTVDVVDNHIFTFILLLGEQAVGYGHLDKEDDRVWLGIVVKKDYQGMGLSKEIMKILIDKAIELHVTAIHLAVDHDNTKAIKLYDNFGFTLKETFEHHSIYEKAL